MLNNAKSLAFVGIVALLVGGCGSTVDGGGTSSSSGMPGTGGTGGNGTGGNGTGGMGTGGTAGSAGAGGGGSVCGGFSGVQCAANEYCDYPDDICGAADGQGVCRLRPEACPDVYIPTCACDGQVHGNECEAAAQGFDVSNMGGCMPPIPGLFSCGHRFCDSKAEYCLKTSSDVPGTPDSYSCASLPAACAGMVPSCACIGDPCGAPIPGMCVTSGDGHMVTCPGG